MISEHHTLDTSVPVSAHVLNSDTVSASGKEVVSRSESGPLKKILRLNASIKSGIAGVVAGCATAIALHPLDIVKTRFQVSDGLDKSFPVYKNTWNALKTIAKNEGVRGVYAGVGPALVAGGVSWGLYFLFYSHAKDFYGKTLKVESKLSVQLASATQAGVLTSLITHPLWLLKTRLQLQVHPLPLVNTLPPSPSPSFSSSSSLEPYRHPLHAVSSIFREEKLRGFYRGLGPSLLLVSHGVIQMVAYEALRRHAVSLREKQRAREGGTEWQSERERDARPNTEVLMASDFAALGALSKTVAVLTTYPFQVVRSRLQIRPDVNGNLRYPTTLKAVAAIYKQEKLRGFYKGFVPHILRGAPSSSLTFLVYELVLKILQ